MLEKSLLERLDQKRIIFVFSTGRCGTMLLSKIMELQDNVHAVHESPLRLDNYRWQFPEKPSLRLYFLINKYLPSIAAVDAPIYFESGHLICKDLLVAMIALGVKFELIFLYRPVTEVALSMYQLNDIPGRTKTGKRWYLDPSSDDNIAPINPGGYTDIQLCIWYCIEMLLRSNAFDKSMAYLGWNSWSINACELLLSPCVNQMFEYFGLLKLDKRINEYTNLITIKFNDKIARKMRMRAENKVESLVDYIIKSDVDFMYNEAKRNTNLNRVNFYNNLHTLYKR